MDRLFYDTNILLDVLECRAPWFPESSACLALARSRDCRGAMNAFSISNITYIQRATPRSQIYEVFKRLRKFLDIAPLNAASADAALARQLPDLEDGLQLESAIAWGANYLITRNVDDFPPDLPLLVLSPTEYLLGRRKD